ncbi:MAG: hypothetical protein IPQ13_09280 [Holophagaceae bacterium]|nr:hypothetical protein [Holophagaceae bacterium]
MRPLFRRTVLVLASLAPAALPAHVFPISYGTLALAEGQARLRLRISVHNLHPALEAFRGGHLEMKDGGYDPGLLNAYFKGRLEMVPPAGKAVCFKVVGQEIGVEEIVLDMEAEREPGASIADPGGWKLRNEVLFERSRRQQNFITVEQGGERRGLTFDPQHPILPLSGPGAR